jgi:hypothetical protein
LIEVDSDDEKRKSDPYSTEHNRFILFRKKRQPWKPIEHKQKRKNKIADTTERMTHGILSFSVKIRRKERGEEEIRSREEKGVCLFLH